jgi:hypothetical protein
MIPNQDIAVPIELKAYQDPQGTVKLFHSDLMCEVLFDCWNDDRRPADHFGKLTFLHAWAVRGLCLEVFPYKIREHLPSCIYEVENSTWLSQVTQQRLDIYPQWKTWDERVYRHFVVSGHDNFYEIIATKFDETVVIKET